MAVSRVSISDALTSARRARDLEPNQVPVSPNAELAEEQASKLSGRVPS